MRRLGLTALLAVLAACRRDLEVPARSTLAVVQPVVYAAPRQQLDVGVTGGAGGYRFAFSAGGKLSGADAAVDPATGRYRAGSDGSAQDSIEVTDAAGAKVLARVSVQARVSVSPAIAATAPGGTLVFSVAGGMAPYLAFELEQPSAGQITATTASTFTYRAGSAGDVTDVVVVKDSTGDPAAWVRVQIGVGTRLALLAATEEIAPGEQVTVLAVGGEPQYLWSACAPPDCAGPAPSGGQLVSAAGAYRAGPVGNVTDLIRVTDQNGEQATLALHVGAPLSLALPGGAAPDLHPGVPVQLLAAGGKPPYAFGFARRGERSGGAVDRFTGIYLPGPSVGAIDVLEVVDAAGLSTTVSNRAAVGPLQLAVSDDRALACWSAELNRDRSGDVLVGSDQFRLSAVTGIATGAPEIDVYELGITADWDPRRRRGPSHVVLGDLDGDGRDDLVTADAQDGIRFYLTDLLGNLVPGPRIPSDPFAMFYPDQIARVIGSDGSQLFYTSGGDPLGRLCVAGPTSAASGDVRLRFTPGSIPEVRIECFTAPAIGGTRLMLPGDFDGDGRTDLALLDGAADPELSRDLRVVYGAADPSGLSSTVAFVPAFLPTTVSLWYWHDDYDAHSRVVAAPHGLVIRAEAVATGRGVLLAARCAPDRTWTVSPPFDPVPGGHPILGFAAYTPVASPTTYVGWNGVDGSLTAFDVDLAVSPFALTASGAVTPAPLADAVRCAAFPDVNADGAPDLVTAHGDVLWGRGAYGAGALAGEPRFGNRLHLRTFPPVGLGDFDEDGALDFVGAGPTGLHLVQGVDGQLALGAQIATLRAHSGAAGRFFDAHDSLLALDAASAWWSLRGDGRGRFGPPVAMDVRDAAGSPALFTEIRGVGTVGGVPALVDVANDPQRGTLKVLLIRGPSQAVVVTAPPFPGEVDRCEPATIGELGDPTYVATLAMACLVRPAGSNEWRNVEVRRIVLSGIAGTPAFGAWSAPVLSASDPVDERADVGGAWGRRGEAVLWSYFRSTGEFRVYTVGLTTAHADVLSTTLQPSWGGGSMSLRAGGPEDIVAAADAGLVVLRADGARPPHWTIAQELLGGTGIPIAAGPLAPGAAPSVLAVSGGEGGGATGTEVVVIQTDGNGFLR